jgi:tRNA pseudouridine38-40 synthase
MNGEACVRVIKMTLAYEGTAFAGWQRQPDARTVQDALEQALAIIEERPVAVASVAVRNRLPARVLMRALNVRLPHDLRVTAIEDVAPDFDARRHARAKVYHYTMALGDDPGPFVRRLVWHIPHPLDVPAMTIAASLLVGEHDFAAFQATGSDVQTSVRRLLRSALMDDPGTPRFLRYQVTGTGFLRHMVRNIVGTLVEVGRRRWPPEEILSILRSRSRQRAGATAPPQGLVLVNVLY